MSFHIVLHPEAEKEYIDGFNWYEKEKAGLGIQFETATDQLISKISLQPGLYSYSHRTYREAKIPGFPYTIVFKIKQKKNLVYIVAVYHSKRNPQKKFRK